MSNSKHTIPHRACSILVIGAGELGSAILDALLSHPLYDPSRTTVTLALRPSTLANPDPDRRAQQASYRDKGIALVAADVEAWSEDELATMFRDGGYIAVLHAGGFGVGPGTLVKVTRAVLAASPTANGSGGSGSVEYYVPWQFGVDYDVITRAGGQGMFSEQLDVRDLLRAQSKVDWVIVSCGMFMSFLFEEFWGVVRGERSEQNENEQSDHQTDGQDTDTDKDKDKIIVTALNSWSTQITTTTAADIAKCTANLLYTPDTPINQPVYIAGDTLTYAELADAIARATGRQVVRRVWPLDHLREESRKDPGNLLKRYRVVFAEGKGVSWPQQHTWSAQQGTKMQGVEEFVREKYR